MYNHLYRYGIFFPYRAFSAIAFRKDVRHLSRLPAFSVHSPMPAVRQLTKRWAMEKATYDALGIQPTYMRFFTDGKTSENSGEMSYEYNCVGREDPKAGV